MSEAGPRDDTWSHLCADATGSHQVDQGAWRAIARQEDDPRIIPVGRSQWNRLEEMASEREGATGKEAVSEPKGRELPAPGTWDVGWAHGRRLKKGDGREHPCVDLQKWGPRWARQEQAKGRGEGRSLILGNSGRRTEVESEPRVASVLRCFERRHGI